MGRHLSDHVRQRVIDLSQQVRSDKKRNGVTKIKRTIEGEGFKVSRKAIYYNLEKWQTHKTFANLPPRELKVPQDVTLEMLDFIDSCMENDDELTAPKLTEAVKEKFNVQFSVAKFKRLRKGLGWLCSKSKYCQLVKEVNRQKRLQYATRCLELGDNFDDVLWSDECTVQLEWNGKISFHRWWEPVVPPVSPLLVCILPDALNF